MSGHPKPSFPESASTGGAWDAWEQTGQFMTWRGHRIFYRDSALEEHPLRASDIAPHPASDAATLHGQSAAMQSREWSIFATRPTLVLVHGFPTSSWDWQAIWPALTARYRVVAMDLLGFGFSDKPAGFDYRIEQQTDLVDDLVERLNIRNAFAIVHDYGVSIGQELLHRQIVQGRRPWHIQGMVFLNGGLFPETHRARFIQRLLASRIGFLIARLGTERTFRRSFSAVFAAGTQPTDEELTGFWRRIARNNGHHNFHRLIQYMSDRRRRREDWLSALRNSPVSIRLINGLDDPVSGAHMVARYREIVGEVDCVELKGIGHYPQCEAPAAVAEAIIAWVETRLPAAA